MSRAARGGSVSTFDAVAEIYDAKHAMMNAAAMVSSSVKSPREASWCSLEVRTCVRGFAHRLLPVSVSRFEPRHAAATELPHGTSGC